MKIMKIPQQEWHIDGEFNEVQVLGSTTASERIQVVLRWGHVLGLDSARGFQRCQKPTMTGMFSTRHWWWWLGDDLWLGLPQKIYIYTIYYIMLHHIILYQIILYYIISYYIMLCYIKSYYIMLYQIISYHIILYYIMFCIILHIMTHKLIYTTREVEGQQLTLHSACLIRTADGGTLAPRFP